MTNDKTATTGQDERPRYESPRIQMLSEKEILESFQVTQAMATWWVQ